MTNPLPAIAWTFFLTILFSAQMQAAPEKDKVIFSADDLGAIRQFHGRNTVFELRKTTDGKYLGVTFQQADWPNAQMSAGDKSWDWTGYSAIVMEVKNPSTANIEFSLRVDDEPNSQGDLLHSCTGTGKLAGGESATFFMNLQKSDSLKDYGMRGSPPVVPIEGIRELPADSKVELQHIAAFQIFMHKHNAPATLLLKNIRLIPSGNDGNHFNKIVDAFGQFTRTEWPGKIHDAGALKSQAIDEQAELKLQPNLPDRDIFGGWTKGPHQRPGGFFSTANINGKQWLIDPLGNVFFSVGSCNTSHNTHGTIVTHREAMFTGLPDANDPLAKAFQTVKRVHSGVNNPDKTGLQAFDFYVANLHRKYGSDYVPAWKQNAIARFHSWGFNTIANWSDWELSHAKKIPFCTTLVITGNHARISSGSDYWSKMHDPFDPQFAIDVDSSLKGEAANGKADPWCIGYFVDNELSWAGEDETDRSRFGLVYGTLASEANQPAKTALISHLKESYPSIAKLNTAWNTTFESWNSLTDKFEAPEKLNAGMRKDFASFSTLFARKYFSIVKNTLKKYDPNHLYLGCRFAWHSPEAVRAAAEICDVVSFNAYKRNLSGKNWEYLKDLNKPCIIGEFHFGALDRGMFHPGLVAAANQKQRGEFYAEFMQSALDHPAFVGCHWFQYVDEPLTGRSFDGENYNIGFVSITDTPYAELVESARKVHGEMYQRRSGK